MNVEEINYHRRLVIVVEVVCKVFTFTSFALRLWVRHTSKAEFWWDDYIMAIGLV